MPLLAGRGASSIMVAAPNMLGSLARIPSCMLLEKHTSRMLHFTVSCISLAGIIGLTILAFATQNSGALGVGIYVLYVIFGCVGGIGKCVKSGLETFRRM